MSYAMFGGDAKPMRCAMQRRQLPRCRDRGRLAAPDLQRKYRGLLLRLPAWPEMTKKTTRTSSSAATPVGRHRVVGYSATARSERLSSASDVDDADAGSDQDAARRPVGDVVRVVLVSR